MFSFYFLNSFHHSLAINGKKHFIITDQQDYVIFLCIYSTCLKIKKAPSRWCWRLFFFFNVRIVDHALVNEPKGQKKKSLFLPSRGFTFIRGVFKCVFSVCWVFQVLNAPGPCGRNQGNCECAKRL